MPRIFKNRLIDKYLQSQLFKNGHEIKCYAMSLF